MPWSRVLFENLILAEIIMKILAFHENRRFISVFTTAHHWVLS
jgi:hypothetical protein